MMTKVVYILFYKLILFLFGLYWLIEWIFKETHIFLCGHKKGDLKYDQQFIENNIKNLNKLPQHIVLALGHEYPDPKALAKFLVWVATARIQNCTVYDHKGKKLKKK